MVENLHRITNTVNEPFVKFVAASERMMPTNSPLRHGYFQTAFNAMFAVFVREIPPDDLREMLDLMIAWMVDAAEKVDGGPIQYPPRPGVGQELHQVPCGLLHEALRVLEAVAEDPTNVHRLSAKSALGALTGPLDPPQ